MTTIGDIIFAIVWFGALIVGIRLMSNGWSLMSNDNRKVRREWKDHYEDVPEDMREEIKKSTHPEMQDLQPGDELIVVKFTKDQQPIDRDKFKLDSPVLHETEGDPLYKSLQSRIDTLREEIKKDEKEDKDDDDGGAPVVSRV